MYQREAARYRVEDMVREAEAYRRSKGTASARAGEGQGKLRRAAGTALSLLVWPFRH